MDGGDDCTIMWMYFMSLNRTLKWKKWWILWYVQFTTILLKKFFLSKLYVQHGAWTHNPKIKSGMLYWLSQVDLRQFLKMDKTAQIVSNTEKNHKLSELKGSLISIQYNVDFSFFFFTGCLEFIFHLVQGTRLQGMSRCLVCGLESKEWGSLNFLFGVLLFWYKRTQLLLLAAAYLVYEEGKDG